MKRRATLIDYAVADAEISLKLISLPSCGVVMKLGELVIMLIQLIL
ncbi:hypothetical protein C7433_110117 [Pantoea sp. PNA 03-3]|nr:hypothetical protein C7433_110117 [Pantoea sp. PNA 03-3]